MLRRQYPRIARGMSETDGPINNEDGIDEGKRLVRARGLGGLSLGERLSNQFYRLTWRTPLHALRLRGRYPLKLLVAPHDPIAGSVERGQSIMGGQCARFGHSTAADNCDFGETSPSEAFQTYLQSFAWLRDLAALNDRAATTSVAEHLTRSWLARYAEKVSDTAWRADIWGQRILNWAAHAPLILGSSDLVYRSSVLNAMARGARHLDRVADRAPIGVARVTSWAGVIAAGLLMPGGEPRRIVGESGLERAINAAFLPDGGSACRSPQNLMAMISVLSMLESVYDARKMAFPAFIDDCVSRGVPALLAVVMGDGGLSSWQGGAGIGGQDVDGVIAASAIRARPLRQARDWGYQRITAGATTLVIDAAPPPVSRITTSGCASTLAIEVSDGRDRLIVNCGGARLAGQHIPASLAVGLRTTAAHSTLTLADTNSTAVHSDGQLGKGVEQIELDRQETGDFSRIDASHDGYEKRIGLIHKRSIAISADGREIRCDDILIPGNARRKPEQSNFAIRFHLGAAVEASTTADGFGALLRIDEGPLWQFKATGGVVTIDDSLWVDGEGALYNTQQLVVSGEAPPGGASISWVLRRAG
jgi:uncharacterized heparinase superfamily protein